MNGSLDDELRRSLHHQADRVPRRPDLTRGAITQARGIRRRRRIASGVAAAVLVAIALPLGLWVGDNLSNGQDPVEPPTPSGPTRIPLDLRALPADDMPALPHLDGRTIVGDGIDIDVPGRAPIASIAPVSDGVYVATGSGVPEGWPLTRYDADGSAERIGNVVGGPVASADGRWVTYVTRDTDEISNPVGAPTLVLVDDETGDTSTVRLPGADAYEVDVHAIVDGTVYFTYDERSGRRVPLQTWSSGDPSPQPVAGDLDATAVSPDGRLVAHLTKVADFTICSAMVDRETRDTLWRTCKYQIGGFSPDGRYVWAFPAYTEGYAATSAAILDAETGELVRQYEASKRLTVDFLDAVFEDDDSLLIRAEQGNQTSLLRCELYTGNCAAAGPLANGTADDTGSPPYLLPDVG